MIWPDEVAPRALRIRSALWTGEYEPAIATLQADPRTPTAVRKATLDTFAALKSGDGSRREAAAKALALLAADPATLSPLVISALAALGHNTEAIAAADRFIASRDALAADILFDPSLASARRSPEFAALVARLGLLDYWRRSGHAPDFCGLASAPPVCAGLKSP